MKWPDHPELVRLYDVECAARHDYDYYLALVASESGDRALDIADIGCGTGVFALDAAARGHRVIGIDPSATIVERARTRPGGDTVTWIVGTSAELLTESFDLIVMMGHVAQYFVDDDEWAELLGECHRALRPGGLLAFETRDVAAAAWERWTEPLTRAVYEHPDGGTFESWVEVVNVIDSEKLIETHEGHTLLGDGTHLVTSETLVFRSLDSIRSSLEAVGFDIERIDRDWTGRQAVEPPAELIFHARRPTQFVGS